MIKHELFMEAVRDRLVDVCEDYRKKQQLSSRALARLIGITDATYVLMRQRKHVPSLQTFHKICTKLGVSADELLDLGE